MIWLSSLLIVLLALSPWKETEAQQPQGYYVKGLTAGFYLAPRKAIARSNATHVLTTKVNNCTCKNACFAIIQCQAWSIAKFENGSAECRVSTEGPATGVLEDNPNSTYFFREGTTCFLATAGKIPTYPPEMMENVALFKTIQGSPQREFDIIRYAVDESVTTKYTSLELSNPWFMIDLGTEKTIFMITMHPIYLLHDSHFSGVQVRLGNTLATNGMFSSSTLLFTYAGPYDNDYGELKFFCNGVTGRYLSVQIISGTAKYLVMNNFQAFAIKN